MKEIKNNLVYILGILAIILAIIFLVVRQDSSATSEGEIVPVTQNNEVQNEISTEDNMAETTNITEIKAYISGEVVNSGVYTLDDNSRVSDLVILAGGFTEDADENAINLARYVKDEDHIIVPSINDDVQISTNTTDSNGSISSNGKININTATKSELETLTGIGDTISDNIINYREENGGFNSIEEIKNVNRIGDGTFENIKDTITVN